MSDKIKTPTVSAPKGLVNKLCEIMAAIDWVEKRGRNEFHKYAYATEADLVEAVRGELAKRSIFVFPNVKTHTRTGEITDIMVSWNFVDGESGESYECNIPGSGQDKGDKGVYKALTGSEKYLLMKAFLIPTGDDPEADSKAERVKPKQAAQSATPAQMPSQPDTELPNVYLEPGKQGFCTITGGGLAVILSKLYETEKTLLGLAYDGNFWTVPIAQAFRFADACVKHGVGVVHMDSSAAKSPAPNGGGAQPSPASPSRILKGIFVKTGEYGSKSPKKGQKWELRQVIWGDSRYATFNKDWWPLLEAGKGKPAILSVVEPTDKGKDGLIDGILRIGDTEYEQIEGKTVAVIQRN